MKNKNITRGCLIGGAAGDALGYTVEFCDEQQIFDRFGENGITEYMLTNGKALISDDTQMTMFTAEGLISADGDYVGGIRRAYRDWYITQTTKRPDKADRSCLLQMPEMYSRRAPGLTCMCAIEEGAKGSVAVPVNDSKGCGGIMRIAPVGLFFSGSSMDIICSDMLAAEAAAVTHGHELGYIPAAALAHIIRMVCEGAPLKTAAADSISAMEQLFPDAVHIGEFKEIMELAVSLSEQNVDDLDAIHQLGAGWVAEETLAVAVYCSLKYENDIEKALTAAVNHGGDSDSTGAVTGNILGAYLGYEAIPQKFREHLELHDEIVSLADKL